MSPTVKQPAASKYFCNTKPLCLQGLCHGRKPVLLEILEAQCAHHMKILFVCSQNHCSSILSEAIANYADDPRLKAASVASHACGHVHPLSLQYLEETGIPTAGLKSQSWDELKNFDPDVVVTVGDPISDDGYPQWLANSVKLHWGLADPSIKQGTALQIKAALLFCLNDIICRTHQILELDLDNLSRDALKSELMKLGAQG